MNTGRPSSSEADQFKSLQILDELSNNDSITQRDLSNRLGIALGLVNSYIKNLVAKGYVTVKAIPPKRYAYYLTPKGFAEKTRLTYHLLQDYTRIYREAKSNLRSLFKDLAEKGAHRVIFAGTDEVAEIAYITLQETGFALTGVVDEEPSDRKFFGRTIQPIPAIQSMNYDCIVVTSYLKGEQVYKKLLDAGADKNIIRRLFTK
jgi:DNA-binding MarR family transcriptional regulator